MACSPRQQFGKPGIAVSGTLHAGIFAIGGVKSAGTNHVHSVVTVIRSVTALQYSVLFHFAAAYPAPGTIRSRSPKWMPSAITSMATPTIQTPAHCMPSHP